INVVNVLTNSYPYGDKSIGQVVGHTYWNESNANANFWATDGIASLGEIGILVSSFVIFLLFILFNRISQVYNKTFLILVLVPYLNALLNMSLFTSLLTGGAFIIFFLLSFKSSVYNPYVNENINYSRG